MAPDSHAPAHGPHDRTHTASRSVAAEPMAVYEALTRPERLVRWLPPAGARGHIELFEPVAGGRFRMILTFSSAAGKSAPGTDVVEGRFVELTPGKRVVQAATFESDDPRFAGIMTMTWLLSPQGSGTRVTVIATDVPRGISRAEHELGMASSLSNLAAFLAG